MMNGRIAVLVAIILIMLPTLVSVFLHAGFLDIANESLAYRFFFVERVLGGDFVVVGVGYLVSLIHYAAYTLVSALIPTQLSTLPQRIDLFALFVNLFVSSGFAILLAFAALSKYLENRDRWLLALVTTFPIYGTYGLGFDYALMADYQFLNLALAVSSLLLLQLTARCGWNDTKHIFWLSVFSGVASANKITVLAVAYLPLVYAFLAMRSASVQRIFSTLLLSGAVISCSFATVHIIAYLGRLDNVIAAVTIWLKFVTNPGQEPAFWQVVFPSLFQQGGFVFFAFTAVAVLTNIIATLLLPGEKGRRLLFSVAAIISLSAFCYFVVKRPAQATVFDSGIFSLSVSCMLLSTAPNLKITKWVIHGGTLVLLLLATITFPAAHRLNELIASRKNAEEKWGTFFEVIELAGRCPIDVVFPDNTYHHEGPFELFLKGASTFPTWTISTGQYYVLDHYGLRIRFRHLGAQIQPDSPYVSGHLVVWFEKPQATTVPMSKLHNSIQGNIRSWNLRFGHWAEPTLKGSHSVTMLATLLEPAQCKKIK